MASLAGIAFDLFVRLLETRLAEKAESEMSECRKLLKQCRTNIEILQSSYDTIKKSLINSSAMVAELENTITRLRSQINSITKEKIVLRDKYSSALVRLAAGSQGPPSLEEYDIALREAEDTFSKE